MPPAGTGAHLPLPESNYLPDFSSARAVVALVLISQLVAVGLTVATGLFEPTFFPRLASASLLLVWIALLAAAALALARPWFRAGNPQVVAVSALLLVLLSVALVSEVAWRCGQYFAATHLLAATLFFPSERLPFLGRNLIVGALVTAGLLRYFYVSHQWRMQIEHSAEACIAALQARIRPHFLFNSMNTIAALIPADPRAAEQAVEDLAELFRASLARPGGCNTLREELDIARVYQRMEQQRLGGRLQVDWQVDTLPPDARLPGLTLQPLLENAIYHGIEPLAEGGVVTVTGTLAGEDVKLSVSNPVSPTPKQREGGHQLALDNIRQRLQLQFGARAAVSIQSMPDRFSVELTFPQVTA